MRWYYITYPSSGEGKRDRTEAMIVPSGVIIRSRKTDHCGNSAGVSCSESMVYIPGDFELTNPQRGHADTYYDLTVKPPPPQHPEEPEE
jgi:hypothetical protein